LIDTKVLTLDGGKFKLEGGDAGDAKVVNE